MDGLQSPAENRFKLENALIVWKASGWVNISKYAWPEKKQAPGDLMAVQPSLTWSTS